MTIRDLRCDVCGRGVPAPTGGSIPAGTGGVRFAYHPGQMRLGDDSGLMCERCWIEMWTGITPAWRRCVRCGVSVTHQDSLHVRRLDEQTTWQLCATDAVEFLNRLHTVQPKLDPETFRFPLA